MTPELFWQEILPSDAPTVGGYPARFADGRILLLPIRALPDGKHALASLIINQASFTVVDALAMSLAQKLAAFAPDIIVGLPTLGLTLASAVAQKLGHTRYVPLGNSAKFWYSDKLSVPLSSVTTPDQHKRLFIDPRMIPLLAGRRIGLNKRGMRRGASCSGGIPVLEMCG